MKIYLILTLSALLVTSVFAADPIVVLKLDDMVYQGGDIPPRWQAVIQHLEKEKLKFSIGIICNSLETGTAAYLSSLANLAKSGNVELWNHGFDHERWQVDGKTVFEFCGPSEAQQKEHFQKSQQLGRDKLGIEFVTFGAPFNATDGSTAKLLSSFPEIQVWLYQPAKASTEKYVRLQIDVIALENPVHRPNLAALKAAMEAHPDESCYVLQGHSNSWGETELAEFVRIIEFLKSKQARFVLPKELPALVPAA